MREKLSNALSLALDNEGDCKSLSGLWMFDKGIIEGLIEIVSRREEDDGCFVYSLEIRTKALELLEKICVQKLGILAQVPGIEKIINIKRILIEVLKIIISEE